MLTSIITSLTVTVSGYLKVTVYATNYSESGYDYTEVGPLDGEVTLPDEMGARTNGHLRTDLRVCV